MLQKDTVFLALILSVGFFIRIYNINLPLLDSKPHREIHTAEETRNLYLDGELLYPKTKLWADEPGFYLVEFPIYNAIVASIYHLTGSVNETWGRFISTISSLFTAIFFYKWSKNIFGKVTALWTLIFFYLVSPQEIILSRSFQPDQLGFFFGILCIYFFTIWIDRKNYFSLFVALSCICILLLIKISFFPFLFPILAIAWYKKHSNRFNFTTILLCLIACLPALLWFYHVKNVYAAYPQLHSNYLLNTNSWFVIANLTNIKWYINILFDFSEQVTTIPVLLLATIGLFLSKKKNYLVIYFWFLGLLIYALLFSHNLHYWYYQVPFLFPTSILAGLTIHALVKYGKSVFQHQMVLTFLLTGLTMGLTSRPYLLRTYSIPEKHTQVLNVAHKVKELTRPNGKIVASSANSAALTYYSLRPDNWGATLDINDPTCLSECTIKKLEELRQWGATIYAVADQTELKKNPIFDLYLTLNYKNIAESDNYAVFILE